MIAVLTELNWYLVVLICVFLVSDIHWWLAPFPVSFAIRMSSWKKMLIFKIRFFIAIDLHEFFMYFGYYRLSDTWFTNIFSHWIDCLFILLIFFAEQKLFSLVQLHLFIFAFVAFAFDIRFKNSSVRSMPRSYLLCFLWGVLWFQIFNLFWVDFHVWDKMVSQFYSFACDYPVFPVPFIEETVLSSFYVLGSFVIN